MSLAAICVGGEFCGSDWFYGQLRAHDAFCKSPVREIGYLSTNYFVDKQAIIASRFDAYQRRVEACNGDTESKDKTLAFLARLIALPTDSAVDLAAYIGLHNLFSPLKSMDVCTEYSNWLPERTIRAAASALDSAKIFLIVRNPVDRLWASAQNAYKVSGDHSHMATLENFQDFAGRVDVFHKSFLSLCFTDWSRYFDRARFKVIDYRDIIANPETVRDAMASVLGIDPTGFRGEPYFLRARDSLKNYPMQIEIENWCEDYFANEKRKLHEILASDYALIDSEPLRLIA